MKTIYLWLQVIFSALLTLWAAFMLGRCIIGGADIFYWVCFAVMAWAAYSLMLKSSIRELKEEKEG